MATPPKKKQSLEEFLGLSKPVREEYVTAPVAYSTEKTPDGKVVTKSKTAQAVFDPKTKEAKVSNQAIDVNAPLEEAQSRPLKSKILPPEVPGPELLPQKAAPVPEAPKAMPVVQAPTVPEGPNVWERLLMGATPALVGLLSGNELEGVQIGANQIVSTEADLFKRQRDLASKIDELKAKRSMGISEKGVKPNYARQVLHDPKTGKDYVHSVIDGHSIGILGEAPKKGSSASFMKEKMVNPATGQVEIATINPQTKEVEFYGKAPGKYVFKEMDFQGENTLHAIDAENLQKTPLGKTQGRLATEQGKNDRFKEAQINRALDKVMAPNSLYNKSREAANNVVKAATLLNDNNPTSNNNIKNFLARSVFDEKGPLSDSDRAALVGSQALDMKAKRLLEQWATGDLADGDANDIRQILERIYPMLKKRGEAEVNAIGAAYKVGGYDELQPRLQAYADVAGFPSLPAYTRKAAGSKRDVPTPKGTPAKGLPVGTVINGMRFLGGNRKDPNNWEKAK